MCGISRKPRHHVNPAHMLLQAINAIPAHILLGAIKVPCFFLILSMYRRDASGERERAIISRGEGVVSSSLHCMGTLEELWLFAVLLHGSRQQY